MAVGAEEPSSGIAPRPTVNVLGRCAAAATDGTPVTLSTTHRRILTLLAARSGDTCEVDDLTEAIWGANSPRTAKASIQNHVSRIRALLGDDVIATVADGYRLRADVDTERLAKVVAQAEMALAAGDAQDAFSAADEALTLQRGVPYADLDHVEAVRALRRPVAELHTSAEHLRLSAGIELGRLAWAVPEAERLVAVSPYDEQAWASLATALERVGRRGDALAAIDRARTSLRQRLGLDPGPLLSKVEAALLGVSTQPHSAASVRLDGRHALADDVIGEAVAGRSVLVVGEEGSGRSTLLLDVARGLRRADRMVAQARCSPNAATAASVLDELLSELGVVADRAVGPIEGFLAAVRRVSVHRPVALIVDDMHLAGPSSQGALQRAATDADVTLVASSRRDAVGNLEADVIIRVPPLERSEVAALSVARLGPTVHDVDDTVDWLARMSGGNPTFLECLFEDADLAHRWREGLGPPSPDDDVTLDAGTGSSVLAELVRRRLERLGSDTVTALEVAAVCGTEPRADVLDRLAPERGVAAALATGILLPGDAGLLAFRHDAVRSVVYRDIPAGRRLELHHAISRHLVDHNGPVTVIAHHSLAAVELDPAAAVSAARQAAAAATVQGAHRDAARWCERAVEASAAAGPRGEQMLIEAMIARGDALRLAGDPAHFDVLLEAADRAETHGDPRLVAEAAFALLQLGATTESGAPNERAVALAEHAIAVAPDDEQRAVVSAAASLAYSLSSEAQRSRELFLSAVHGVTSAEGRRKVLPFTYLGLGRPQDLDQREAFAKELMTLAEQAGDPVSLFEGLHLDFSVGLQRAQGDRVRLALERMDALVDRVGDVGRRWALLYQMAAVAHLDDDLERSEQLAEEAMALFGPVSPSRAFAAYGAQLLVIRMAQGRLVELVPLLEGLVVDQPGVPAWHAALAMALCDDDADRARHHAAEALVHVQEDFTWLPAHVTGARAAARHGDAPTVAEYRRRLEPLAGLVAWQGTCAFGPVDTALALLAAAQGDDAAARAYADTALTLAESLRAPVFVRELS